MPSDTRGTKRLTFFLTFFLLIGCLPQDAMLSLKHVRGSGLRVIVYHPWWAGKAWRMYDWDGLDEVYFFDIELDGNGYFKAAHDWPLAWLDMIQQAKTAGVAVAPTITLSNRQDFVELFGNRYNWNLLIQNILEAVRITDAPVVHLDIEIFESVPSYAREGFTEFVATLRKRLRERGGPQELSMYLLAHDPGDVFDERRLARWVDYFIVQGYDLHWADGAVAGPVAPISDWDGAGWNAILRRLDEEGIPRKKLIMAIPFYGYEWPVESPDPGAPVRGKGRAITYAPVDTLQMPTFKIAALDRIRTYGFERDPKSGSPFYVFQDSTGWYQGWFEDPESIRRKIAFIKEQGLAGVAVFSPAYDNGTLWNALRTALEGTGTY